jgi:hypothetical protein
MIYLLFGLGFMVFMIWIVARNFASDAPFLLDVPPVNKDVKRTKWQQIVYAIRCVVYALIWLVFMTIGFGLTVVIVAGMWGYESMPDSVGYSLMAPWFVVWMGLLRYRVSLRWPLMIVALCLVPLGGVFMTIIGATGLGKLIIMSNGRWSVFAGSRLKSGKMRAKPRGLVEVSDND